MPSEHRVTVSIRFHALLLDEDADAADAESEEIGDHIVEVLRSYVTDQRIANASIDITDWESEPVH